MKNIFALTVAIGLIGWAVIEGPTRLGWAIALLACANLLLLWPVTE